ncbi:MAG: HEAT repeat domain-containing protein [Deltaproteobacteria bacterium]|nr:HEAT repeat domain-containing protein [Deltaproteobacteria bacterium]MBN2687388.1 HEAT repeat domain-containing protein [Deltaproteobacteria bacterium]
MTIRMKGVILAIAAVGLIFMGGCALNYTVKTPTPSALPYTDKADEETALKIVDQRMGDDKKFSVGRAKVNLVNISDEMAFLSENLVNELNSRGIAAITSDADDAALLFTVRKYRVRNHQSTGFSPFQTAIIVGGDFVSNGESKKLAFYFRIGKVPIWSMKEVVDPCYNIPLSLMVKELASKINRFSFGLQMPREKVEELVQEIQGSDDNFLFMKVLELGYTNHPAAVGPLLQLADHSDGYVRASAICSLGVLGAVDQFEFLKKCYYTRDDDEKLMALKSIGDLNTPESRNFLRSVKNSPDYGHARIREVLDLFL